MKRYLIFPTLLIGSFSVFFPVHAEGAPVAPSNLVATSVSSSEIRLAWQDNSTDELGILLYRSTSPDLPSPTIIPLVLNTVSYFDTELATGAIYYYQVYACNVAGCGVSNVTQATTQSGSAPPPGADTATGTGGPVSVTGVPSVPDLQSATAVSACAVKLDWTQPDPADYFNFKLGAATPQPVPGTSGEGAKSFTHTELAPGRTYRYQVQACATVGGCSALSGAESATIGAIAAPPAPPTDLQVTKWEASGGRAVFSWVPSAIPANSGFRIFRSDDGGATFRAVETISLSTFVSAGRTWKNGISTDALHIYKIKAYQTDVSCAAVTNDTPETASHVKFSAFSSNLVVPARPASVAVRDTQDNRTRVRFQWDDVAEEDVFRFEMSSRADFQTKEIDQTYNRNVTQTNFLTVQPDKTFYYRVRACAGSDGNTACSDYRAGAQPFVSGLIGPRNLSATVIPTGVASTADVLLGWEDAADYYHATRVYRKLSTDAAFPATPLTELSGADCVGNPPVCNYSTSYVDRGRPLGSGAYDYRVRFVALPGGKEESEPSNTASVNMNLTFLDQWGWANVGASGGKPNGAYENYFGIGWVRLAYHAVRSAWGSATAAADAVPYAVAIDDKGFLSGYAWSPNSGWLSFNARDLAGCPAGTCEAGVNLRTGEVNGWARFTSADSSQGAWHGWVSLRGTADNGSGYGLIYATTTWSATAKVFSGYAWGGDVTGWLGFGIDADAPNLIRADVNPTPSSLTLEFRNPIDYDDVKIYQLKSNNPEGAPRASFERRSGVPVPIAKTGESPNQVVVPSLDANSTYGFFLQATKAGEAVESVVKSGTTSPTAPERYSLSCLGRTTSTVTLGWSGNVSGAHTLALYRGNTESGVLGGSRTQVAPPPALTIGSGTYQNTSLAVGTTYYYLLSFGSGASNVAACTTLTESSDAPSLLNVWPVNDRDLYVNWKDNATEEHSFTIERIRVTPRASAFTTNPQGVTTESASSLALSWQNSSDDDNQIGPFYHVFERSTSSTPFADRKEDGTCKYANSTQCDPSFAEISQAFLKDTNITNDPNAYTWSLGGLQEGAVYSARTRACSFIRVNLVKGSDPRAEGGDPETTVCGGYSGVGREATKPAAPSNLQATSTESSVSLSFRDNSARESGFHLYRNGALIETLGSSAGRGGTVSVTDSNLATSTSYTYAVRSFIPDPNVQRAEILSDESNSVTIETLTCAPYGCPEGAPQKIQVELEVRAPFLKTIAVAVADVFHALAATVRTVFARIEIANVPGGGPIDLNAYFARHVRANLSPVQYPSVLRDTGLEPNTVYVYRVKAVYAGGETAYALEGAGKTLPSGGTPTPFNGLRICTKNSFCDSVSGTRVVIPPGGPENTYDPRQKKDGARFEEHGQCQNNNDCRDVHTSRQFFEER